MSPKFDRSGMSLIEVLTTMGLIGGVMTAVFALNEVQNKNIRGNRIIASRDNLRNLAERYAQDPAIIGRSAVHTARAGNAALYSCLVGTAGPRPPSCAASETQCCKTGSLSAPQPFSIIDPADPSGATPFSGTEAASAPLETTAFEPARYNDEGSNCTSAGASNRCPIELFTSFIATCANGALTCEKAASIQILYTFKHAEAAGATSGSRLKTLVSRPFPIPVSAAAQSATEAAIIAGIPGPSPTPAIEPGSAESRPAGAVMYLRCESGQDPPQCPTPHWSQTAFTREVAAVSAGSLVYNKVRTCMTSNGSCVAMYLRSEDFPPACPADWTPVANPQKEVATTYTAWTGSGASSWTHYNWVRTCFKCAP